MCFPRGSDVGQIGVRREIDEDRRLANIEFLREVRNGLFAPSRAVRRAVDVDVERLLLDNTFDDQRQLQRCALGRTESYGLARTVADKRRLGNQKLGKHQAAASLFRRPRAASSVSCFLQKQKRTHWSPTLGVSKKLDPGTQDTPMFSTR